MKHGFQLLIHKALNYEQKQRAKEIFYFYFIFTNGNYGTGGQASYSFWRRGILGYSSKPSGISDFDMVVRRMSTKRRIFAAIPRQLVDDFNIVHWNQCMCSQHLGGTKVHVPFIRSDYEVYYETGDIRG